MFNMKPTKFQQRYFSKKNKFEEDKSIYPIFCNLKFSNASSDNWLSLLIVEIGRVSSASPVSSSFSSSPSFSLFESESYEEKKRRITILFKYTLRIRSVKSFLWRRKKNEFWIFFSRYDLRKKIAKLYQHYCLIIEKLINNSVCVCLSFFFFSLSCYLKRNIHVHQ